MLGGALLAVTSCSKESNEILTEESEIQGVTNEEMMNSLRANKELVTEIPNYTDTVTGLTGTLFILGGTEKDTKEESWFFTTEPTDSEMQDLANGGNIIQTGTVIYSNPDVNGDRRWVCKGAYSDCMVLCNRWKYKWD